MKKTRLILASALCLSFLGCMKKPSLEDDDGTPASADQVQNAIVAAWGQVSPLTISNGEFSYLEKDMAIGDMPARVIFQEGKTVQAVSETETEKTYTILQQIAEIDSNNQQKLSTSERTVRITKSAQIVSDPLQMMSTALPLSVEIAQQLLYTCVRDKDWDANCYNLKTWDSLEAAPSAVASREGCEGLPNCQWRQKNVAFDLVLKTKDEKTGVTSKTKASYTIKMSPDAPYLSRLTEFCYQGIGTASGTHFPVLICHKIKNFRRAP